MRKLTNSIKRKFVSQQDT